MQTQKFFLQLTDSDYNATSEKYNIDIEEQGIRNPAEITFESVTAKFSSDDDYLLINSNALASVAQHRPSAVNGLYGNCVYVLHPEKRVVRAEETTVTTTTPLSDDSILDLADLFMFLNWDDATRISPPAITTGDNILSITSMLNSNFLFTTSSSGLEYQPFGQTFGMKSTVAWHYAYDNSTADNPNPGNVATLSMMFRTKPVLASFNWIMKSPLFELTTGAALGSASVMGYFDRDSMAWGSTALAIQGGTDYFLQVKKTGSNFEWLLRDLGTDIEQTETTSDTRAAGVAQDPVALTDAQTGFLDMTLSHYVQVLNDDVADALTVKNWLLAKYAGDTTTSSTVTSSTTYQVFSKTPKIIPCRQQSTTMHSLDLQFVNPAGAVVKPLSGILEVLVKS